GKTLRLRDFSAKLESRHIVASVSAFHDDGVAANRKETPVSQSALLVTPSPDTDTVGEPSVGRGLAAKLGAAPAWVISAGVHLLVLFLFAGIVQTTFEPPVPEIISAIEDPQLDQFKFENATVFDEVGNDSP